MKTESNVSTAERLMKGAAIGLLVSAGMIWYFNHHYPASYSMNFLYNCEQGTVTATSCDCMLNGIKQQYSYADAKQFDQEANSGVVDSRLQPIIDNCSS